MKIIIEKNLHLSPLSSALGEWLRAQLTFPNPKWVENAKMGRWNRGTPKELQFFDKTSNGLTIPRGFLRQLILRCRQMQLDYELVDRRRSLPPVRYRFQGQLRGFQNEALDKLRKKEFGTLNAPTGSGKTVIALDLIARRGQPALILVHTRDLAQQWIDRIGTFLAIPAGDVGYIGGGSRSLGQHITVAMVQSLYKCAPEVAPAIGFLVVDECHRCPSRTFTEAVTEFDCRYMLGLTATPWRRDNLSRLIFWHLGDIQHEIDKAPLIASGDVLPADVVIRPTGFKPYYDPIREYSKMLAELTADDERNRLIAADVAKESERAEGVCLVLSDRKKHCEVLQALLRFRHKLSAHVLTGDLKTAQRQTILEQLQQGEVKILIATGQLIGEGFDCKHLSPLFLATPIRFSGRVLQYLGRVLRPAPGKTRAKVYDYVDVEVEVLAAAAAARQRVYGKNLVT